MSTHIIGCGGVGLNVVQGARLAGAAARQPALRKRADAGVAEEEGRWRREAQKKD